MGKRLSELLDVNYSDGELDDFGFAKHLGLNLEKIHAFEKIVWEDLDSVKFGIGWWTIYEELGFKRRVLISDQLYLCLSGINTNLIEGRLHLYELFEYWDQESTMMKFSVSLIKGKFQINHPSRLKPLDDLPKYRSSMHLRASFSSMCSAIDCLSSVIVAVMGLQMDVMSAGYPKLKNHLRDAKQFQYANKTQKELLTKLEQFEEQSGPVGWLRWVFDYRNMSIHRGRRMNYSDLRPVEPEDGKITSKAVKMLIKNPKVSDVESMKDQTFEVINEDAVDTLEGSFNSCLNLINLTVEYLSQIWGERKNDHSLIVQPSKEQWRTIHPGKYNLFSGYSPDPKDVKPLSVTVHGNTVHRMKVASLAGDDIYRWKK